MPWHRSDCACTCFKTPSFRTFHSFPQLPVEIQRLIWLETLDNWKRFLLDSIGGPHSANEGVPTGAVHVMEVAEWRLRRTRPRLVVKSCSMFSASHLSRRVVVEALQKVEPRYNSAKVDQSTLIGVVQRMLEKERDRDYWKSFCHLSLGRLPVFHYLGSQSRWAGRAGCEVGENIDLPCKNRFSS